MIISPLQLAETCIIDSFEMLEAPQVPTHLVYGDKTNKSKRIVKQSHMFQVQNRPLCIRRTGNFYIWMISSI